MNLASNSLTTSTYVLFCILGTTIWPWMASMWLHFWGFYSYDRSFQRHMYTQLHYKPKNDMKIIQTKWNWENYLCHILMENKCSGILCGIVIYLWLFHLNTREILLTSSCIECKVHNSLRLSNLNSTKFLNNWVTRICCKTKILH